MGLRICNPEHVTCHDALTDMSTPENAIRTKNATVRKITQQGLDPENATVEQVAAVFKKIQDYKFYEKLDAVTFEQKNDKVNITFALSNQSIMDGLDQRLKESLQTIVPQWQTGTTTYKAEDGNPYVSSCHPTRQANTLSCTIDRAEQRDMLKTLTKFVNQEAMNRGQMLELSCIAGNGR